MRAAVASQRRSRQAEREGRRERRSRASGLRGDSAGPGRAGPRRAGNRYGGEKGGGGESLVRVAAAGGRAERSGGITAAGR